MKTILVPVEQHDRIEAVLEAARLVALSFGSCIEGFALRPPPLTTMGWDPASAAILHGSTWDDEQGSAEMKAYFQAFMNRRDIPHESSGERTGIGWRWNDEAPAGDAYVGTYGRVFDVTVIGRPGRRPEDPRASTLESALFESGRPIIIAPPEAPQEIGRTVVIAWNGSTETARTIAFAKPFLRKAERVVVFADDSAELGPAGHLVHRQLVRNDIPAELQALPQGAIRSGETILAEAAALGCDLLIKGAYTQSRLRQMIFGGATSTILAEAKVPVFMAH